MAFDSTEIAQIRAAVQAELDEFDKRPISDAKIAQLRAAYQAELEEYGGRLWGSTGTSGRFMARTDARTVAIQAAVNALVEMLGQPNQ